VTRATRVYGGVGERRGLGHFEDSGLTVLCPCVCGLGSWKGGSRRLLLNHPAHAHVCVCVCVYVWYEHVCVCVCVCVFVWYEVSAVRCHVSCICMRAHAH
jgi:hypothetical protein